MSDPLDFTGKVVLVTGSSRGIGAETIKAFGERGAKCVVNYVADPEGKNKADAKNVATNPDRSARHRMRRYESRAGRIHDDGDQATSAALWTFSSITLESSATARSRK